MRSIFRASARLCVCACLVAGCGKADWREAEGQSFAASRAAREMGYVQMSGPHNTFGTFSIPGRHDWRVHLEAHHQYFLAAACVACGKLDFLINEPHGGILATDTTANGPFARLEFVAPEEGDFHVIFDYDRCDRASCNWVAQLYERPGGP